MSGVLSTQTAGERRVIRRAPGAGRGGRTGVWPDNGDELDTAPTDRWSPSGLASGSDGDGLRPLLVWLGVLVIALCALLWLGRTPLASPPVSEARQWWRWAQLATTDQIAFNLLRLGALGVSWYLLGVTTVGAVARLADLRGLVRLADRLTIGPVRQLLQVTLGLTLATGAVGQVPGAAWRPATPMVASSVEPSIDDVDPSRLQTVVPGAIGQQFATSTVTEGSLTTEAALVDTRPVGHDAWLGLLDPSANATVGAVRDPEPADAVGARRDVAAQEVGTPGENLRVDATDWATVQRAPVATSEAAAPTADRSTRIVIPGDHFWSIASEVVGPDGSDAAVATYWEHLVNANLDRLVDRANPDLLLPGQVLILPSAHR